MPSVVWSEGEGREGVEGRRGDGGKGEGVEGRERGWEKVDTKTGEGWLDYDEPKRW